MTVYLSFLLNLIHLCFGSSVWMNPGICVGVSQNQKPPLNQINKTNSAPAKRSTAVSNQGAHCGHASSSHIPTISFDLGNEWDDWGDFDDENLVHASETPLALCPNNVKPQVQQSVDYNMPGRVWVTFKSADKRAFHTCRKGVIVTYPNHLSVLQP